MLLAEGHLMNRTWLLVGALMFVLLGEGHTVARSATPAPAVTLQPVGAPAVTAQPLAPLPAAVNGVQRFFNPNMPSISEDTLRENLHKGLSCPQLTAPPGSLNAKTISLITVKDAKVKNFGNLSGLPTQSPIYLVTLVGKFPRPGPPLTKTYVAHSAYAIFNGNTGACIDSQANIFSL